MTVQDFIVIYNETFRFVDNHYGRDKVDDLWAVISRQWCTHLRQLVEEKGQQGMLEYWAGSEGTLNREKAGYSVTLENDVFSIVMAHCPSVNEIKERGYDVYPDYCEHCQALYGPIMADNGYLMTSVCGRQNGIPDGTCTFTVNRQGLDV